MIISREVREVFILLSLLGDLEFGRFGDFSNSSLNTEAHSFDRINRIDKIRKWISTLRWNNFNAEGQRSRGAKEDEENSVSLCLWVYVIKVTQRHKGTEAQRGDVKMPDGVRKALRLGVSATLRWNILTQRGKGADEDVVSNLNIQTCEHSNIQTLTLSPFSARLSGGVMWVRSEGRSRRKRGNMRNQRYESRWRA